jgi:hypothetical protein
LFQWLKACIPHKFHTFYLKEMKWWHHSTDIFFRDSLSRNSLSLQNEASLLNMYRTNVSD